MDDVSPDLVQQRLDDDLARRSAAKVGVIARRARGRRAREGSTKGFRLLDRDGNCIAGDDYSLTAADVVEFCRRVP